MRRSVLLRFCRAAKAFDVYWFEEPLWYDVWRVCETAHAYRLPVAPHAGDMSQVHVHLNCAHPACAILEYVPWIKDCFLEPADVVDGVFRLPQQAVAGTTPTPEAWQRLRRPPG